MSKLIAHYMRQPQPPRFETLETLMCNDIDTRKLSEKNL